MRFTHNCSRHDPSGSGFGTDSHMVISCVSILNLSVNDCVNVGVDKKVHQRQHQVAAIKVTVAAHCLPQGKFSSSLPFYSCPNNRSHASLSGTIVCCCHKREQVRRRSHSSFRTCYTCKQVRYRDDKYRYTGIMVITYVRVHSRDSSRRPAEIGVSVFSRNMHGRR